jgi:hypothetical protein
VKFFGAKFFLEISSSIMEDEQDIIGLLRVRKIFWKSRKPDFFFPGNRNPEFQKKFLKCGIIPLAVRTTILNFLRIYERSSRK